MISNPSDRVFAQFDGHGFVPVLAWTEHSSPQAAVPCSDGVLRAVTGLPGFQRLVDSDAADLMGWSVYPAEALSLETPELPATVEVDPRIRWSDRADGALHTLVRGIHFRRPAPKVQRAAIMWGHRNGYTAATKVSADGNQLSVKFVPRTTEV